MEKQRPNISAIMLSGGSQERFAREGDFLTLS